MVATTSPSAIHSSRRGVSVSRDSRKYSTSALKNRSMYLLCMIDTPLTAADTTMANMNPSIPQSAMDLGMKLDSRSG